MFNLSSSVRVYVFTQATDMRKGFDRLSELVREHLKRSALEGGLFVFFSRRRDRVKILLWEEDGYVLIYKRLEAGVFRVEAREGIEEITGVDLRHLLEGMDLSRIKLRSAARNGVFNATSG